MGSNEPCTESISPCLSGIAPAFLGAGGNIGALSGCDKNAIASRLQPRVQCKGVKPTVGQLAGQLNF